MSSLPPLTGKVLVTFAGYGLDDPMSGALLREAGLDLCWFPRLGERSSDEIADAAEGVIAAIVDVDPFDDVVFRRVPELRLIARTGVGIDAIDLEAATRAGVAVTTTPGLNHETVADHSIALMLACLRRIVINDRAVREGRWERIGEHAGWDLHGSTVGLIGCGRIGDAVARRLLAFGTDVLIHDPLLAGREGCEMVALDDLLRRSDIVSLHAPLLPETEHLINASALSLMKDDAVLVNTSRGGLIDEGALFDVMDAGKLRAVALDVFENEPPPIDRIGSFERLIVSPHLGGMSATTIAGMSHVATRNVIGVLTGNDLSGVINPAALEARAAAEGLAP